MFIVTKNGRTTHLHNEVQLAAYLKSGWIETTGLASRPPTASDENGFAALKAEADTFGLKYHPNIGYEKLLEKVNAHKEGDGGEVT